VASMKQRSSAKQNIKKAAAAAKRKRTHKRLPKATRRALGKRPQKPDAKAASIIPTSPFIFVGLPTKLSDAGQVYACQSTYIGAFHDLAMALELLSLKLGRAT
jgi:hypothetical protein